MSTMQLHQGYSMTSYRNDRAALPPARYFTWQGARCRLAGAALLLPALPLIGLLVVLVRLTSRGPGVFRQTRVGRNGRVFVMYKLRTMSLDAEAGTGPVWAQPVEPRVTRMGVPAAMNSPSVSTSTRRVPSIAMPAGRKKLAAMPASPTRSLKSALAT